MHLLLCLLPVPLCLACVSAVARCCSCPFGCPCPALCLCLAYVILHCLFVALAFCLVCLAFALPLPCLGPASDRLRLCITELCVASTLPLSLHLPCLCLACCVFTLSSPYLLPCFCLYPASASLLSLLHFCLCLFFSCVALALPTEDGSSPHRQFTCI